MSLPFTAGQRVLASDLNTACGLSAWTTSFVPTWTQSGGAPAFGNAVVVTGYQKVGRVCVGRYQFTFGSTTNFGTGVQPWLFTLPLAGVAPASNLWNIGSWSGDPAGTFFVGSTYINSSGLLGLLVNSSANSVETTNPGTWANGNFLEVSFQYETTS